MIEGELKRRKFGFPVERAFGTVKSVLDTRPIYDKCPIDPFHQRFGPAGDETIKGHAFASFCGARGDA